MIRTVSLLCACVSILAGAAVADCKVQKIADLPVTMAGDPLVDAKVNGTTLHFVADSGAFFSLISPAVALQLNLRTTAGPSGLSLRGAGGVADMKVARARDFQIAGDTLHDVEFLIAGNGLGPDVAGLLGQNILGFADIEYDLANGVIRLWKPAGCGNRVLAYWLTKDQPFGELNIRPMGPGQRQTIGEATINGHKIQAMFDTGGGGSFVTAAAARRAGVDVGGAHVMEGETMKGGIGLKTFRTFIVPVQTFEVGGEEIHNTRLIVGDPDVFGLDMWIGVDFFLSHRVYVSNTQHRMYFTYNGGPVFDIAPGPKAGKPAPTARPATLASSDAGLDAAALARRGDASAARGDFQASIADLTRARVASPDNADFAFDRARTYHEEGQADLAMADVDDAIRLRPDHMMALILRAELRMAKSDKARAIADIDAAGRLAPRPSNAHLELAELYMSADAPESAIAQYDLWLQGHPEDVDRAKALNGRCWARAILGQALPMALADCAAALRSNNKMAEAHDSRGLVYLRLGQYVKSIADYDAALAHNPKIAWSLYGRGIAKLRLGRKAEGHTDIAAAVALAPKLPATAKGYGVTP